MPFLPPNQQRQSTEGKSTVQQWIDISQSPGPQQQKQDLRTNSQFQDFLQAFSGSWEACTSETFESRNVYTTEYATNINTTDV